MQRVWFYAFFALGIFAIGLLLSPNQNFQNEQAPTATLDPLYGTVTTYMEDFYARNTVMAAKGTATALSQNATETEYVRNPLPYLLTGTAIELSKATVVGQQNDTVMVGETATTEFLMGVDPLYVTATTFILQATQTVSKQQTLVASGLLSPQSTRNVPTATPLVAFTIEEFETLQAKYKSIFISSLGFDHPIFDIVIAEYLFEYLQEPHQSYAINLRVESTWFKESKFVALIIN